MQENNNYYSSSSITVSVLIISFLTILTSITIVILCLRRKQKNDDDKKEENLKKDVKNDSEIKILNESLSKLKSQDTISISSIKSKIPVRKKFEFKPKPKGFLKEKIAPQDDKKEVQKPTNDKTEFTRINEKSPPVTNNKLKEKNGPQQQVKQKIAQDQDNTIVKNLGTQNAKSKNEQNEPKVVTTLKPIQPKITQKQDESIQSIDINPKIDVKKLALKKKEQDVTLDIKKLKGIIKKVKHDRSRQNGKVSKRSVKFFSKVEVWARTPTFLYSEKSFAMFDDLDLSNRSVNAANAKWFPGKTLNQQQPASYAFRFKNKLMAN